MVAFANAEAVAQTLATRRATFFSRSRQRLWVKGETSGHVLDVREVTVDCDADALVYRVVAAGPTCHTGTPTCFFRRLDPDGAAVVSEVSAGTMLGELERVIRARRASTAEASYVKSLHEGGAARMGAKICEEADELARAVAGETAERVVAEAADLVFHVLVALGSRDVTFDAVLGELDRRMGRSGHDEKRARKGG